MFVDYVTGASIADGDESPSDSDAAKICRVIIAGGTMDLKTSSEEPSAATSEALKELDIMLAELASAVPVDVMSGKTDPTNKAMPQQPLHPVYFPEASKYEKTMCLVTNPHDLTVDQTSFLGTSGQNVEDVMKFSTIDAGDVSSAFVGAAAAKRPVAALTQTLRWQHIAPGAPDTLACYPFQRPRSVRHRTHPAGVLCGMSRRVRLRARFPRPSRRTSPTPSSSPCRNSHPPASPSWSTSTP